MVQQQHVGCKESDVVEGVGRIPPLFKHQLVDVNAAGQKQGFDVVVILEDQHSHLITSGRDGLLLPPRRGEEPAVVVVGTVDERKAEGG